MLNFTPSKISKTIQALEEELQIKLFIRKPHELTPTPAAVLLADEWRQIIGSYNHALRKVRLFLEEEEIIITICKIVFLLATLLQSTGHQKF